MHFNFCGVLSIGVLIAGMQGNASAEMTSAATVMPLESLLVVGSPTTENIALTSGRMQIEAGSQLPGLRLDSAELLQGLAGVQADSRSNYAQDTRVTLRGFGARSAFGVRGVDLLVDGVPLSTPDGQGQLSSVFLDEITAVEVIRGPLAALYGNGAGGVINLQTQAPVESLLSARVQAGEDNLARQSITGQWRQDNLAARLQASALATDGARPHASAEREQVGAQGYYIGNAGLEAIVRVDTSHDPLLEDPLGLTEAQWQEDPNQTNPLAEAFNTRKAVTHRQASVTLRQAQGSERWQTSLWRGTREITQYLAFTGATSAGGVVDLARDFYGLNGHYTQDFTLFGTAASVTLGAEVASSEDRRRGYVNNFGVAGALRRDELDEVTGRDLYTLVQWRPSTNWNLYGGLRHSDLRFSVEDYFVMEDGQDDSGERDFADESWAMGASYNLSSTWSLFASVGRGFETPTQTEMAYSNDTSGLNLDLKPSHNRQQEVGMRYRAGEIAELAVTLFGVDSTDEIVVDQSVGGRTTYHNAAATERQGIELSGNLVLDEAWSARLNANFLQADYAEGEWQGNQLPGVAQQNHYLQLTWQPWWDERFALAFAARYRSRVATGDDNQTFAPAATTADLALSSQYDLGDWRCYLWLKLANLTDERYVGSVIVNQGNGRSFEPAPARNASGGVELTYAF